MTSVADLRQQVKAPIVMPILCLSVAVNATVALLRNVALVAVNLALFDLQRTKAPVKEIFDNALTALYFTISAVAHALWQLAALVTRSVSTARVGTEADSVRPAGPEYPLGYSYFGDDGLTGYEGTSPLHAGY